jgi:hypothetical protein
MKTSIKFYSSIYFINIDIYHIYCITNPTHFSSLDPIIGVSRTGCNSFGVSKSALTYDPDFNKKAYKYWARNN